MSRRFPKAYISKRDAWWKRQKDDMAVAKANAAALPGTLAWAVTYGPELCEKIKQSRPDLAKWSNGETNHPEPTPEMTPQVAEVIEPAKPQPINYPDRSHVASVFLAVIINSGYSNSTQAAKEAVDLADALIRRLKMPSRNHRPIVSATKSKKVVRQGKSQTHRTASSKRRPTKRKARKSKAKRQ